MFIKHLCYCLKNEEGETLHLQCKENSAKSKSCKRSSFSEEWTSSSAVEEDDKTDRSCSKGRLTDAKEGTFPVCKLQYVDLKNENIFYDNKPDSIKEFVQKVKVDILENLEIFFGKFGKPYIPDFENSVNKFSSLTKENLLISCEFDLNDLNAVGLIHVHNIEDELMKHIQSDLGRIEKVDKDLDYSDL